MYLRIKKTAKEYRLSKDRDIRLLLVFEAVEIDNLFFDFGYAVTGNIYDWIRPVKYKRYKRCQYIKHDKNIIQISDQRTAYQLDSINDLNFNIDGYHVAFETNLFRGWDGSDQAAIGNCRDSLGFPNGDVIELDENLYAGVFPDINMVTFYTTESYFRFPDNAREFFDGCRALSLDLSGFDTSNVINMSKMFSHCTAKQIKLSSFTTAKVEDMSDMFHSCDVKILDLTGFKKSKVKNTTNMFKNCSAEIIGWVKDKVI